MTTLGEHVVVLDGTSAADREVVGNKGLSIARMVGLGLTVPPAFALPIDECRRFNAAGGTLGDDVWRAKSASPASRARAASTSSVMPRLRTVSIIPGIEARPPERTDTSNGFFESPNALPVSLPI